MPQSRYNHMERDRCCDDFIDELLKLRPHTGHRLTKTLALQKFDPQEHPRDLARAYDKVQRREAALSVPAKGKRLE